MQSFPFLIVGDVMVIKCIDIVDIDRIVKHCPKPSTSALGAIAYLKKACKGRNYTQEDIRIIIDSLVGTTSPWDWTKVPTIDVLEAPTTKAEAYSLNTLEGRNLMWEELEKEMKRVFINKSSLPTAVACKQKSSESVLEFWKRFQEVWTQDAGLNTQDGMHSLLIQTYLSNLAPKYALVVRQQISDWATSSMTDFQKKLTEKDAAGCFDIPKQTPAPIHYQDNFPGNQRGNFYKKRGQDRGGYRGGYRGRGQPQRGDFQQRQPKPGCFNCGDPGHWKAQCPWYDRECTNSGPPAAPTPPQAPPSVQQQHGVKYPISWKQQQSQ